MKRLLSWLTGKRQPPFDTFQALCKLRMQRKMTLNQILDYNLRAGELKVVW